MTLPNTAPNLPTSFAYGAELAEAQYDSLTRRYADAASELVRMAVDLGDAPNGGDNEAVMYVRDEHRELYVHRLGVTFQPAKKNDRSEDVPSEALLTERYLPSESAADALQKQARHGLYVTSIALQRSIAMQDLGPGATMYDARNEAQLVHQGVLGEVRYKVDPDAGRPERIRRLPGFSGAVTNAYNQVVFSAAQLLPDNEFEAAYAEAVRAEASNPHGPIGNIPGYTRESRDVPYASQRIRHLVETMDAANGVLDAGLVGQLMIPDTDRIAALALLNPNAYYKRERGRVSFGKRLGWVQDNASKFCARMGGFVEVQTDQFQQELAAALIPAEQVVGAAESMVEDVQPPKAAYIEPPTWRVSRTM